jgi:arginyl-tRNA synthetase
VDIAEDGDTKELPPCIVKKTDGAFTYATSDLATILCRERDYKPSEIIYLTDKRQDLHFTQVFRAAKKAGIAAEDTQLVFIGFGTYCGSDGKPYKSRDGGVLRLSELLDMIYRSAYDKVASNAKNADIPADQIEAVASKVALAAIKYGDLSTQTSKDFVFDVDKFTSFEGNTGPYILYTMVRIKSILEKAGIDRAVAVTEQRSCLSSCAESQDPQLMDSATSLRSAQNDAVSDLLPAARHHLSPQSYVGSEPETQLMLAAAGFSRALSLADAGNAPNEICRYIYALCDKFNKFYHENKIIAEENAVVKANWIALIVLVLRILETGIYLLGFSAPDKM